MFKGFVLKKRERGSESLHIIDEGTSTVLKYPQWLGETERMCLFENMSKHVLPLMTHDVGFNRFTGKEWKSQRLVGTIAVKPGVSYKYGTAKARHTLTTTFEDLPWLDALRKDMEALCGQELNFVFINWYRPGTKDNLGWHSDDEADMSKGSPIVSVSVGDARWFAFRKKGETKMACQSKLVDGDIVIMQGNTQQHYEHAITTREAGKNCVRGRWNLTFRHFPIVE